MMQARFLGLGCLLAIVAYPSAVLCSIAPAALAHGSRVPAMAGRVISPVGGQLRLRGGEDGDAQPAPDAPVVPDADAKTAFDLEAWKRTYSNAPEGELASVMPTFWDTLDTAGWSIWFCEYQYNEDYAKAFMATNLIRGWHQRMDGINARKFSFGACHVFGEEPKLELGGCWLIQGQEIPAAFQEVDDYAQWTWTKADLGDEATRKTVEEYWKGEEGTDFGKGRTWRTGVVYK